MVNNLLFYSCYNSPTCFDAIASSSGGSWLVPAKLHQHLNAVLVMFLNFKYVLLLKFRTIAKLKLYVKYVNFKNITNTAFEC
jgi:hypothetical protein